MDILEAGNYQDVLELDIDEKKKRMKIIAEKLSHAIEYGSYLKDQNNLLNDNLEKSKEKFTEVQVSLISDFESKSRNLNEKISDLKSMNDRLSEKLKKIDKENKLLKDEIADLKKKDSENNSKIEEMNKELFEKTQDNLRIDNLLKLEKKRNQDMNNDLEQAQIQADELEIHLEKVKAELNEQEIENKLLKEQMYYSNMINQQEKWLLEREIRDLRRFNARNSWSAQLEQTVQELKEKYNKKIDEMKKMHKENVEHFNNLNSRTIANIERLNEENKKLELVSENFRQQLIKKDDKIAILTRKYESTLEKMEYEEENSKTMNDNLISDCTKQHQKYKELENILLKLKTKDLDVDLDHLEMLLNSEFCDSDSKKRQLDKLKDMIETGKVVIEDFDKDGRTIIIKNRSDDTVDISQWKLLKMHNDSKNTLHIFPSNSILESGESVQINGNEDDTNWQDVYNKELSDSCISSNGDKAILQRSDGIEQDSYRIQSSKL